MNMRNSGIDWIGEIPEHWEIQRGYNIYKKIKNINSDLKEDNVLSLSYGNIIMRDLSNNKGLIPKTLATYQVISKQNIVLRLTDMQNDKTSLRSAISGYGGIISSAYLVLEILNNNAYFLNYFFKTLDQNKIWYNWGGGVRQTIKWNDIKNIVIPLPPRSEQDKIANFLDEKVTKIDRVIELGEQRIKSLNEYKTSLIYETVTKGLNKDAVLKESGIEWVGEIPEHWEIKKLKKCISFLTTGKLDVNQAYPVGKYPFFSCSEKQTLFSNNYAFSGESLIIIGNGNPGFVSYYNGEFNAYQRTYVLQGGECLKFLFYNIKALFKQHTTLSGSVIKYIKLGDFNNYMVCLPPKEEQQAIADYLDKETSFIDREIAILKKQTESFKKYKESLIYECVTGKYNIPE